VKKASIWDTLGEVVPSIIIVAFIVPAIIVLWRWALT
jgi:hypothetical protein